MQDSVQKRLIKLIADVTRQNPQGITLNSLFIDDLEINSLDLVELACLVEGEFGVAIPMEQITSLRTVRDVLKVVNGNGTRI